VFVVAQDMACTHHLQDIDISSEAQNRVAPQANLPHLPVAEETPETEITPTDEEGHEDRPFVIVCLLQTVGSDFLRELVETLRYSGAAVSFLHPAECKEQLERLFPRSSPDSPTLVTGTPLQTHDLTLVDVERAASVIIVKLSNRHDTEALLSDAQAAMAYTNVVTRVGRNVHVIAEIHHERNMGLIGDVVGQDECERCGDVITAPAFVAGFAFSTTILDSLLVQLYFNARVLGVLQELVRSPRLRQIPVPEHLIGRTYAAAFSHLARHEQILTLGVYHLASGESGDSWGNIAAAVVVCPNKTLILERSDKLYIILPRDGADAH